MVNNQQYTFSKEERLSWKRHIDLLFEKGESFIAFPLRVIFFIYDKEHPVPASVLVSVPKKRIKRAVKRNLLKRRIREAYRLRKSDLTDDLVAGNKTMFIAFLYVDKEVRPYADIEKAMIKAINILKEKNV